MKKLISFMSVLVLLTGCSCGNAELTKDTPTNKVEKFFSNYQTLNEDVLTQLNEVVESQEEFTDEQKQTYKEIMKDHYKNLKYEIKDESIDGDTATVVVEIEVKDYSKVMSDADKYLESNPDQFNDEEGNYSASLFNNYRLEQLKKASDKVKYTLNLTLTKVDDEWIMDDISDIDENKILGMYVY